MPQGLNKVKRRISTVENTRKITNAMKLISSVKVRQIQNGYVTRVAFNNELNDLLNIICNYASTKLDSPLLKVNQKINKKLYIVVSSSLGLCGSYNYNVARYLSEVYKNGDEIITIGEKIDREVLKNNEVKTYRDFKDILNNLNMSNCRVLQKFIIEKYMSGEYSEVILIYTKYINQIASKVAELRLLPLDYKKNKNLELKFPDLGQAIDESLLKYTKKYITSALYIKLFESLLSEQSARRNAMDNADKNAEELVDKLRLEYNKARQTAITQEITEVVSGSVNK